MSISLLGVPWDAGNGVARGSGAAAEAIRSHLSPTVPLKDIGDVAVRHGEDAETFFDRLSRDLREQRHLLIGGDHSISFTPIRCLAAIDPLSVVWIDAHLDFSNFDGAAWHDHKQVLRRIAGLANVERIVQHGYRGITVGDERHMHPKLEVVPASRVDADLASRLRGTRCYVSIDVDAIDPRFAPGTATPVPGGLSVDQIVSNLQPVFERFTVCGMDLVEYSPRHDVSGVTAELCADLVARLAQLWVDSGAPALR